MVAKDHKQGEKTDSKVAQGHFSGAESVLYCDYGSDHMTLYICQTLSNCMLIIKECYLCIVYIITTDCF